MAKMFEYDDDRELKSAARVRALESLLIEKGLITGDTVDQVLKYFETEMGPFNGAKVVAKAWVDPAFKELLLEDPLDPLRDQERSDPLWRSPLSLATAVHER